MNAGSACRQRLKYFVVLCWSAVCSYVLIIYKKISGSKDQVVPWFRSDSDAFSVMDERGINGCIKNT